MEGCGYRDRWSEFEALGVRIVGVSFDTPEDNHDWALAEGFQFELWSDPDRTLALHYGAASSPVQWFADRVTKVIDCDGTLVLEYPTVAVAAHPQEVLEDCQALFTE